jgi:hypothetical protein
MRRCSKAHKQKGQCPREPKPVDVAIGTRIAYIDGPCRVPPKKLAVDQERTTYHCHHGDSDSIYGDKHKHGFNKEHRNLVFHASLVSPAVL